MIWLIVDSTFGIEREYAKKNNIKVVDLKLVLDGKEILEGPKENWAEFYDRLEKSASFPTTSQPNPNDFEKKIDEIQSIDKEAKILILTISKTLSGTINSATLSAKNNKNIQVFDTGSASAGASMIVEEIVSEIKQNKSFAQIVQTVPKIIESASIYFIPSTMEYLKRGGRIGKLSSLIASVLHIKPVFKFKNGIISVVKKAIGIGRAIADTLNIIPKTVKKICICYIHAEENLPLIKQKVESILGIKNVQEIAVSPVLGSHIGIGAVGIACMEKY